MAGKHLFPRDFVSNWRWTAFVIPFLFCLLCLLSLGGAGAPSTTQPAPSRTTGSFTVLTYNIDGLPAILKAFSNDPARHAPLIGRKLHEYDLVNVQEDFSSHAALYANDSHPYRTLTSGSAGLGSGLNTLSNFPFEGDIVRVRWNRSSASDGNHLTPKGFTLQRIGLTPEATLDLYNFHTNAGSAAEALAVRRDNILQLCDYIRTHSAGHAVIVCGDSNCRYTRVEDNIRELSRLAGLTDVWVQLIRHGAPPTQGSPALVCNTSDVIADLGLEFVDKIFYRSSPTLTLTPSRYDIPDATFRDAKGEMLSDHRPISATFTYTLKER